MLRGPQWAWRSVPPVELAFEIEELWRATFCFSAEHPFRVGLSLKDAGACLSPRVHVGRIGKGNWGFWEWSSALALPLGLLLQALSPGHRNELPTLGFPGE